jgi:AcrR family transcriptional regulator
MREYYCIRAILVECNDLLMQSSARPLSVPLGLRERKKRRTRDAILQTALRLFTERGFDAVSVAEIADAVEVSVRTVYNYFPTKEHLVFDRMEAFEQALLAAIRDRAPGESTLEAFRRFVLTSSVRLEAKEASEVVATAARMITASPALQAHEREVLGRYTDGLAALLAEETRASAEDVGPWIAANALMGVHRALLDDARRHALAGRRGPRLALEVRRTAERALALLERGLGGYAVKREPPGTSPRKRAPGT